MRLARHFVDVFAGYDAVVDAVGLVRGDGAGAVPQARPQPPLAAARSGARRLVPTRAGREFAAAVDEVASRVYDLTEFLSTCSRSTDVGAYFPHRVTYHPTCHSLRGLRLGDRPPRLLRSGARAWSWSSCPARRSAAASAAPSR